MKNNALVVHREDDVATVLENITEGQPVRFLLSGREHILKSLCPIPFGHKIALRTIEEGHTVRKYGEIIGRSTEKIEKGCHVHIQNLESTRARGDRKEAE